MAISTKILKTRISSIKNTQKITKAMELVAASKMRKAVNNVALSRSYSETAWQMLTRLKTKTDPNIHKLLHAKEDIKRVLILLITSNRGLCGGYNAQIINKCIRSINKHGNVAQTDLVLVGKKGRDMKYKFQQNIIAEFDKEDVVSQVNEVFPISRLILDEYIQGKYDRVLIAYTDFISSLKQVPRVRKILPITEKDDYIGEVGNADLFTGNVDNNKGGRKKISENTEIQELSYEYLFEPTADVVLEQLLPRLIEMQIYQAYLEANASEHSSRMLAMRNASDAAEDMIFDLNLSFNQARQASITREIAEISAGKAVIE